MCNGIGARGKLLVLEQTHRAIPQNCLCPGNHIRIRPDCHRADIKARRVVRTIHVRAGARILPFDDRFAFFIEFVRLHRHGHHVVHRQKELNLPGPGFFESRLGDMGRIRLHQRFAGLVTLRQAERISHRAANQNRVGFFNQTINHLDFVRNLRTAKNDNKWADWFIQFIAQKLQLALHEQTGGAPASAPGHHAGDAFG